MPSRLMRDLMDFTGESFLEGLRSRRILVTGATGLIGSSVIKALVQASKTKELDIRITAVIRDQTKADRIFKDTDLSLVTFKILDMNGLKATDIPDSDLEIITAIAEEYVAEIFRRLREHHYDEDTMDLYVCGGGGCLIKNFYQGSFNRVKFIDDICAAAKGYEYLADVYLRAEAKNER